MHTVTSPDRQALAGRLTISVAEFCHLSGLGKTKTFSLIKEQKLEVSRVGRRTLISLQSALDLITPGSSFRKPNMPADSAASTPEVS